VAKTSDFNFRKGVEPPPPPVPAPNDDTRKGDHASDDHWMARGAALAAILATLPKVCAGKGDKFACA
jgi:hypothetical protein